MNRKNKFLEGFDQMEALPKDSISCMQDYLKKRVKGDFDIKELIFMDKCFRSYLNDDRT